MAWRGGAGLYSQDSLEKMRYSAACWASATAADTALVAADAALVALTALSWKFGGGAAARRGALTLFPGALGQRLVRFVPVASILCETVEILRHEAAGEGRRGCLTLDSATLHDLTHHMIDGQIVGIVDVLVACQPPED